MPMQPYTEQFFKEIQSGSRNSAKKVVPKVLKLIQPTSIIDVGCGVGTWLLVFREHGVEDVLGVDGGWINKKMLQIEEEKFISFDLKKLSESTDNLI